MPIRRARAQDVPAMLAIYAPYVENTAYSFEYSVPGEEEFLARFEEHARGYPWLVWEEGGAVAGYAYAGRAFERMAYSWCAEISVYISREYHGRGIGRALYAEVERILKMQGVEVVYAVITSGNPGSVRFHEALGYTHTAFFPRSGYKLGSWHGVHWLEKRLGETDEPAGPPVSWNELETGY